MSAVDALSNPITIGTLITLGGSLIGFITFLKVRADAEKELEHRITVLEQRKDCSSEVSDLKEEFAKWSAKNEIMWSAIEPAIINVLHHPHPEYFARDSLLEKLQSKTITQPELVQLENLLGCEVEKKGSTESLAATLLIARIRQMMIDAGNLTCFNMNKS